MKKARSAPACSVGQKTLGVKPALAAGALDTFDGFGAGSGRAREKG